MARKFVPQIITANDLFEGDVIYLTSERIWVRDIKNAEIANTPEEVEAMLDFAKSQPGSVVGAYPIEIVTDENGKPEPTHFREEFRTRGPSNYFHGKQADKQLAGA